MFLKKNVLNSHVHTEGSTVLHIDISDAVNIIMYVGQSQDVVIDYDDNMTTSKSGEFLRIKLCISIEIY